MNAKALRTPGFEQHDSGMRQILLALVLTLAALSIVPAPATASHVAGLTFKAIITDSQDFVGFLDIREIAIAEPGDGTIILRFTTGGWTTAPPPEAPGSIHLFMTTPGWAFRAGVVSTGAAVTHSSSVGGTVSSCAVESSIAYCVVTYASMKATVGSKLTGTSAISYAQAAQDYAPGTLYAPDGVLGPKGLDYTLTGCTRTDPLTCPGAASPPVVPPPAVVGAVQNTTYYDVNATEVRAERNGTAGTAPTDIYNWTIPAGTFEFSYNATVLNGSASFAFFDDNATSVATQNLTANGTSTQQISLSSSAVWVLRVWPPSRGTAHP
jgi:hypothetical protein